jgi:hypothetical protein
METIRNVANYCEDFWILRRAVGVITILFEAAYTK